MNRFTRLLALVSVLLLTFGCTKDEADNDESEEQQESSESSEESTGEDEPTAGENENNTGRAGEMQRATEKACNKTFECAIAEVPENMRSVINKEQICGAFRGYSDSFALDTVSRPCFRAALDYLNCVGDASCDVLKSGEVCEAESQDAQAKCEGAQPGN